MTKSPTQSPSSLRQEIWTRLQDLKDKLESMSDGEVSTYMLELSVLLASLNDKIADFQFQYATKVHELYHLKADSGEKTSTSKAEMDANITQEAKDLNEAKALQKSLESIISSLKYRHRTLKGELDQFTP